MSLTIISNGRVVSSAIVPSDVERTTNKGIANGYAGLDAALKFAGLLAGDTAEKTANKGIANGYAGLDAALKFAGLLAADTAEKTANKGIANGYAGLDANGYIDSVVKDITSANILKVASANARNSHDAEVSGVHTVYTKVKTITLTKGLQGTARFSFDLKTGTGGTLANAQVARNGSFIGNQYGNIDGIYTTQGDDITQNWNPGDTVELWVVSYGGASIFVRNFRISYDDASSITAITVASTNS